MLNNNIIIGISIIVAVFLLFFYLVYAYEKKRSKSMHTEAKKLNFMFEKEHSDAVLNKYSSFHLAHLGKDEEIINRMWGKHDKHNIAIFEHKYTIPSGEGSNSIKHTVISLETINSALPSFLVQPRELSTTSSNPLIKKIESQLKATLYGAQKKIDGFKEIKLSLSSIFSEEYSLFGKNELEIKNIFNSEVLNLLQQEQEIYIENQDDVFLCYYKSTRYAAKDIPQLIEKAIKIWTLLNSTENIKLSL